MPTPRELLDDLRAVVRGEVYADDLTRGLYATDASPFRVTPQAVVVPADEADVRAAVRYCHENSIPLTPRGAGTGLAGEALGPGVVLDLSVHFRDIIEIGPDTVTVEPGVTPAELNRALAPDGRRFAPDPASGASCTVGGMVATNASGGTAFRHGYTRDHVAALRVVWDDGSSSVVRGPSSVAKTLSAIGGGATDDGPRTTDIRGAVAALVTTNQGLIAVTRPHTAFNRCGYLLHDVLTPAGPDLCRLLVGSEGTLGVVTRCTLRTVPLPGGVGLFALGFPSLDAGLRAAADLRACDGVAGCDLLDQRMLALVRPGDGQVAVPTGAAAAAVVTVEADTERAAAELARAAVDRLRGCGHPFLTLAEPATDPGAVERVRAFRQAAVYGLYALGGGRRPEAFIEDVAVPVEEVPRFVAGTRDALRDAGLTASFLVHGLTGQVHTRPLVDLADPADRAKLWPVAERVHALALSLTGTVSTQHGVGLARTPWVEAQYGPLLPVFRELKRIFDPKNVLNPGKIVGPDPSRPAWPLKTEVRGQRSEISGDAAAVSRDAERSATPATPLLVWDHPPATEAAKCNGCGDCRPRGTAVRMCPVFRATGAEAATPRAKANLVALAAGGDGLAGEDARAVAGLCVNCKMCRSECRAGVDVPRLMLEAKAAHHAEHGLARGDWFPARAETLSALAGNFTLTANLLLGSGLGRWAMEKVFGVARRRALPRFTHRTFHRRAKRLGLTAACPGPADGRSRVALFVDGYANYNDPLIGVAAAEVLRLNGFEVYVPPGQRACGMAPLAYGDADAARAAARANVRALAGPVRDGYTVVCPEPTAAVALTQEYPTLLDDPDARLVAANTVELTALLWDRHAAGKLVPPTRPLPAGLGHHVPCHVKALGRPPAGPRLLGLIPGATVRTIDASCSGMAGTWGLAADNFDASLAAGRPMLDELARPGVQFGSTECSACRMQMQQGTGKRTLHPVQYLALAYGLLPEIGRLLLRPPTPLLTD